MIEKKIPIEYLEQIATHFEVTVDYVLSEFVIDGSLITELIAFVPK